MQKWASGYLDSIHRGSEVLLSYQSRPLSAGSISNYRPFRRIELPGSTLGVLSSMLVNVGVGHFASNYLRPMIASRKGKSRDGKSSRN